MVDSASKTAAASLVELTDDISPIWWNAFAVPCMSFFASYTVRAMLPESISNAGPTYSDNSAWWKFERLQYALETDYPKNIAIWRPIADQLEKMFLKEVGDVVPDNEMIASNTIKMLETVDETYQSIIKKQEVSCQPQHCEMNEIAKKRGEIVF